MPQLGFAKEDLNARKTAREPRIVFNVHCTMFDHAHYKILTKQITHKSHKRPVNEKFALIYEQIKLSARDVFIASASIELTEKTSGNIKIYNYFKLLLSCSHS